MSTTYVALLRGINVGGNKKVPMAALVEVFRAAGCSSIRTYIQSGNVVFDAPPARSANLASSLASRIEDRFGFEVPVVLRTAAALEGVTRKNPFVGDGTVDVERLHVAFLADAPSKGRVGRLDLARSPPDAFRVVGSEIYLHLPKGVAGSKLTNAYFDGALETTCTIRNWRTVLALLALLEPARGERGQRKRGQRKRGQRKRGQRKRGQRKREA